MQRIEDTNQCRLVYQSTRQGRHRIAFRIAFMLDRHAATIIGPIHIQTAQDADPVERRFKQADVWSEYFHCTFLIAQDIDQVHAGSNKLMPGRGPSIARSF